MQIFTSLDLRMTIRGGTRYIFHNRIAYSRRQQNLFGFRSGLSHFCLKIRYRTFTPIMEENTRTKKHTHAPKNKKINKKNQVKEK